MQLIMFAFLLALIALVSADVRRRRREHRRAELAKALRYERWKARRRLIPHVSANLCASTRRERCAPILRATEPSRLTGSSAH